MPREREREQHRHRSRSPSPEVDRREKDRSTKKRRRHHSRERTRSDSESRSRSRSPVERKRSKGKGRQHRRDRSSSDSRSRSRSHSPVASARDKKSGGERQKEKEEQRKQKELLKALETPEEKRARRLAKKEQKQRRQREREGWDKDYQGYTNADNPFGDHHLLEKFVWDKKREQQVSQLNLSKKEVEKREKLRQDEMKRELEKVKKRRVEREKEREARDEEMTLLQRMKEAEMFKEWESQEDEFHLEQAKLRSKIRIESGRAKPIDLLAKYISTSEDDMDIEVQEPYHLLRGLNVIDLEDLIEDIKVYSEIEDETHIEFWKDILIICDEEIAKLSRLEEAESRRSGGAERRGGINVAVSSDVSAVFKGKTYGQLILLEEQINGKTNSSDPGTDVGYWESLLQQLKAHMARARLRDRHQAILRRKLFSLKQQQLSETSDAPLFPSAADQEDSNVVGGGGGGDSEEESVAVKKERVDDGEQTTKSKKDEQTTEEPDTLIAEEDLLKQAYEDYETGAYSPKLLKAIDIEEFEILDPEEDESRRSLSRQKVLGGEKAVEGYSGIEMTRSVGADGMAEEEYTFNSEVTLVSQNPIWKEKYKPRKPRFFNRVHTGFEWNKYNQTHYDTDNPPPKIVQGYKFNIFFPDLIDKRATPQYTLNPCKDNPEFTILRFHAGPPYEDIAFRIVNREWECSWKHGFRSQFNNNILQLWFRFKRNRYRR